MPSQSIPAATITQPVVVGAGSIVTVTPAAGATAVVEYTTADAAAVANGMAMWSIWERGSVSAAAADLVSKALYLRVTARGGAVTLDINESPSAASLAQYKSEWSAEKPWNMKILRNEALSRFFGCSGTDGLLQISGQSASAWTMTVKMEMEAPFNAVRLLRINRSGLNALNGEKALVAVTESNLFDTSNGLTVSRNLSQPVFSVGGTPTVYNQMAPAGTVNGYHAVTWPGRELASLTNAGTTATVTTKGPHGQITGAVITMRNNDLAPYNVVSAAITVTGPSTFTYVMGSDPGAAASVLGCYTSNMVGTPRPNYPASGAPTATSVQTCSLSEKTPLRSRPSRMDGGARPLLLYRFWHDGAAQPFPFHNIATSTRSPSAAMRGRTIQIGAILADAVGNLGWNPTLDTVFMDVFPVVTYSVPVLSVWGVGDSTWQNDGLVADKVSSWLYRACASISTPQRPVVYANFGASSQSSAVYWAQVKACLAAGVAPPSALFVGVDSVNDGVCTEATVQNAYALAHDVIITARKYEIPVVVMFARMPMNTMNAAQYALKVAQDTALAELAAVHGVRFVVFNGLSDGAYPERWIPSLNGGGDGFHPDEPCIDTRLANQGADLLLSL